MALYLMMAKFSPEGAKGVQKEGFVSRRENAEKAVGVAGGKVLGYYACGDAEWDLVNLFESPDEWGAAGAAKTIATLTGTGAFSHIRLHPLVTARRTMASTFRQRLRPTGRLARARRDAAASRCWHDGC